jgi:sarcosine oxidase subunit beta
MNANGGSSRNGGGVRQSGRDASKLPLAMVAVNRLWPDLSDALEEEVIGASCCPADGHANPMLATLAYYRKARQLGVRFITGDPVVKIRKIKGRGRQVVTEKKMYEADVIV